MDSKIKILISGDVSGHYKQLFNRVESINKKTGPFEILLCVGEFFGESDDELIAYKNGCKNVPVPTFILGPCNSKNSHYFKNMKDGEICPNLTYLGKRGLYTLSSGIKIAYLSGVEGNDTSVHNFSEDDITSIKNSCIVSKTSLSYYKGVDILITSQWPQGIKKDVKNSSSLISYLIKEIRPRYHFCGMNQIYYEPPPFRIQADSTTQLELATRFISLADVGNLEKQKYIYALNITPVEKMRVLELVQKTTNEISCPFTEMDFSKYKTQKKEKDVETSQFFYDLNTSDGKRGSHGDRNSNKKQRLNIESEKCWFCLSSANVEKQLIISIGNQFYLAFGKGPINEYHILILSVTHIQSASLLSSEEWSELNSFKKSLKAFFKAKGLATCFFERNYKTAHLQINAIGIDEGLEWKIKHSFEDKAEEYNLTLETLPPLTEVADLPSQGPYFIAELNDCTLLTRQMKRFPLHFAREVFCSENVLNCDEKIDWKECNLSADDEVNMVKKFREDYKHFDITL